jgi:hypothetical protein
MIDPAELRQAVTDGVREGMRDLAGDIARALDERDRGGDDDQSDQDKSEQFMDILQRIEQLLQFITDNTQGGQQL